MLPRQHLPLPLQHQLGASLCRRRVHAPSTRLRHQLQELRLGTARSLSVRDPRAEARADVRRFLREHGVPCIRPAPSPVDQADRVVREDAPASVDQADLVPALVDGPVLVDRVPEHRDYCLQDLGTLQPDVQPDALHSDVAEISVTRRPKKVR